MKTLIILMLAVSSANAATIPYSPELEARLNAVEDGTGISSGAVTTAKLAAGAVTTAKLAAGAVTEAKLEDPSTEGQKVQRLVRAVYDVAVDGGSSTAHGLGVTIPGGATITRSFFKVDTGFVGGSTVALSCESANNIFSAAQVTGLAAPSYNTGVSDNTAANMKSITADCDVTATVGSAAGNTPYTAGKLTLWVEYVR